MLEKLKRINRAVPELWISIVFIGLICQLVGMCFVQDKALYTGALWIGVALALITVFHMYRSLDKALEPGVDAAKAVTISNLIRYGCIVVVFAIVLVTEIFNPLVTFLGLMSLKAAVYLQPITHKICNKIFCEMEPYTGKHAGG